MFELMREITLSDLAVARAHHHTFASVAAVLPDELVLVETSDRLVKTGHVVAMKVSQIHLKELRAAVTGLAEMDTH